MTETGCLAALEKVAPSLYLPTAAWIVFILVAWQVLGLLNQGDDQSVKFGLAGLFVAGFALMLGLRLAQSCG